MYCNKCGNELPEGASFCTSCGASQKELAGLAPHEAPNGTPGAADFEAPVFQSEIRPPEIYAQPENTAYECKEKPRKRFSAVKLLITVVLVLVLALGVTALGYFTFFPAKWTLMIAETASVLENFNAFDKSMDRYEKTILKPAYEGTIDSESELSLSIDNALLQQSGLPSETIDLVAEYLKNISVKFGMSSDIKNRKQALKLGLDYQKNPLLTANFFMDGTKFGFSVPELSETTVTGDLKNLEKLSEVFPDIPQEALQAYSGMDPWVSARIYEEVKIDRKDIKKLMLDYSGQIISSIDASDMTIERGRTTDVLGKNVSCQEITVKLDQKAQKKILSDLLDRMKNDDNLYRLTCGNIIKIFNILSENEAYAQFLQTVNIQDILSKQNYRQAILALKSSIDEEALLPEITVKIYIKGLDVVKYAFRIPAGEGDVLLTIEDITEGESYNRRYSISGGSASFPVDLSLSLDKDYNKSADTTNFKAEFSYSSNMSDLAGNISFVIDSREKAEGKSKVNHNLDVALKLDGESYNEPKQGELNFSMEGTKTRNSNGLVTKRDYTGELALNVPAAFPQPISMGFAVTSDTQYGKKVELPDTGKGKVLDIATATQEDYVNLVNEVYEKIGALSMLLGGM